MQNKNVYLLRITCIQFACTTATSDTKHGNCRILRFTTIVSQVMELCRLAAENNGYGPDTLPPSTVQVWFKSVKDKGHLRRGRSSSSYLYRLILQ
jgi:hypothetical protein